MGLPELEARVLSGEAGAEEVSELLRVETERRRSQLHLPATGEGNDCSELDRRHSRSLSLHDQSPSGAHPYQTAERCGRISEALSWNSRRAGTRRTPRPPPFSASAEFQG